MLQKKVIVSLCALMLAALLGIGCNTANDNRNGGTDADNNPRAVNPDTGTGTGTDRAGDERNMNREDFEKNRERYSREAKESGRRVGSGADDLWIWTKTRAALAYENDLSDSRIDVDVDNNVVTLHGTVPDAGDKARAEQVAKGIEGVTSVRNNIKVMPEGANTDKH